MKRSLKKPKAGDVCDFRNEVDRAQKEALALHNKRLTQIMPELQTEEAREELRLEMANRLLDSGDNAAGDRGAWFGMLELAEANSGNRFYCSIPCYNDWKHYNGERKNKKPLPVIQTRDAFYSVPRDPSAVVVSTECAENMIKSRKLYYVSRDEQFNGDKDTYGDMINGRHIEISQISGVNGGQTLDKVCDRVDNFAEVVEVPIFIDPYGQAVPRNNDGEYKKYTVVKLNDYNIPLDSNYLIGSEELLTRFIKLNVNKFLTYFTICAKENLTPLISFPPLDPHFLIDASQLRKARKILLTIAVVASQVFLHEHHDAVVLVDAGFTCGDDTGKIIDRLNLNNGNLYVIDDKRGKLPFSLFNDALQSRGIAPVAVPVTTGCGYHEGMITLSGDDVDLLNKYGMRVWCDPGFWRGYTYDTPPYNVKERIRVGKGYYAMMAKHVNIPVPDFADEHCEDRCVWYGDVSPQATAEIDSLGLLRFDSLSRAGNYGRWLDNLNNAKDARTLKCRFDPGEIADAVRGFLDINIDDDGIVVNNMRFVVNDKKEDEKRVEPDPKNEEDKPVSADEKNNSGEHEESGGSEESEKHEKPKEPEKPKEADTERKELISEKSGLDLVFSDKLGGIKSCPPSLKSLPTVKLAQLKEAPENTAKPVRLKELFTEVPIRSGLAARSLRGSVCPKEVSTRVVPRGASKSEEQVGVGRRGAARYEENKFFLNFFYHLLCFLWSIITCRGTGAAKSDAEIPEQRKSGAVSTERITGNENKEPGERYFATQLSNPCVTPVIPELCVALS